RHVRMIPASFPWDDVGAWDALARTRADDSDGHGNISIGDVVLHDVRDSIVFNEATDSGKVVAVVGLDDIVIVNTEDAVLVVSKDRAQDVKKIVAELRRREAPQV